MFLFITVIDKHPERLLTLLPELDAEKYTVSQVLEQLFFKTVLLSTSIDHTKGLLIV